MKNYYNTNGLSGRDLFNSQEKAERQDDIILEIFVEDGDELTPFEVNDILHKQGYNYPITSIRRSITNLTRSSRLMKTQTRRQGDYGQMNYTWRSR